MNSSLAQQSEVVVPPSSTEGKLRFIGTIDVPRIEDFLPDVELASELGFKLIGKSLHKNFLRPRRIAEPILPTRCEIRGFRDSLIRPSEFLPRLIQHGSMQIGQLWFVLKHLKRPIPGYGACLLHGMSGERILVSALLRPYKYWEIEEVTPSQREVSGPADKWCLIRPVGRISS